MSEIELLFSRLAEKGQTALMPFVVAGDPSLQRTRDVITCLDQCGCHLCEIGFPYSDPIADGPVIQAAYTRALNQGIKVEEIFSMIRDVKTRIRMPLVAMVSCAIIQRFGTDEFLSAANDCGLSGLIVPDLAFDHAAKLAEQVAERELSLVQLVTPTTSIERAEKIARLATGFIYYVSLTGTTGERSRLSDALEERLKSLRGVTEKPICVGFGISQPLHIRQLAPIADGLIVGSALVRRISDLADADSAEFLEGVTEFVQSLFSEL